MNEELTTALADFTINPVTASATVFETVRFAAVNAIAAATSRAHDHSVGSLAAEIPDRRGAAQVWGVNDVREPTWAAFLNGAAAQLAEPGERCGNLRVELGPTIVSAAIAAAQFAGSTGREILDAIVVGSEISLRLAAAVGPSHLRRGWCPTGTTGVIGAAASVARLLQLNAKTTRNAIGLAATQGAGFSRLAGSLGRAVTSGKAAANGVEAAILADVGYDSSRFAIEGARGFAALLTDEFDADTALMRLGETWTTGAVAIGRFAGCWEAQAVVQAGVVLWPDVAETPIAIRARVSPLTHAFLRYDHPRSALEAKFSIPHCAAVGLQDGDAGQHRLSLAGLRRSDISTLRGIVLITDDPSLGVGEVELSVEVAPGNIVHARVSDRDVWSTPAQIAQKARLLLSGRYGDEAPSIIQELTNDRFPDASELGLLLRPPAVRGTSVHGVTRDEKENPSSFDGGNNRDHSR